MILRTSELDHAPVTVIIHDGQSPQEYYLKESYVNDKSLWNRFCLLGPVLRDNQPDFKPKSVSTAI